MSIRSEIFWRELSSEYPQKEHFILATGAYRRAGVDQSPAFAGLEPRQLLVAAFVKDSLLLADLCMADAARAAYELGSCFDYIDRRSVQGLKRQIRLDVASNTGMSLAAGTLASVFGLTREQVNQVPDSVRQELGTASSHFCLEYLLEFEPFRQALEEASSAGAENAFEHVANHVVAEELQD